MPIKFVTIETASQMQSEFENYRQSKEKEIQELLHSVESTLEMQKQESLRLVRFHQLLNHSSFSII